MKRLFDAVEAVLGHRPRDATPLHGGCLADVWRLELPGGERLVAKRPRGGGDLALEGWMLEELRRLGPLPVPAVVHAEPALLLLEWIPHDDGGLSAAGEAEAAELLARLHQVSAPHFGLDRTTPIGPLDQPNPPTARWLDFFREYRLLHAARRAHTAGRLPARLLARIERLAERLERWLVEPAAPALLHGDVWTGNVLVRSGHVAAFVDPAIYYGHPEIEIAFTTLFGPFGQTFYERYREITGLEREFFTLRKDIYNLYPLLIHAQLFGSGYLRPIVRTLDRLGIR